VVRGAPGESGRLTYRRVSRLDISGCFREDAAACSSSVVVEQPTVGAQSTPGPNCGRAPSDREGR
jgi:hypothetical protein